MTIEQTLKDERLLALPDVCAKLSVSKTTVYELTKHCKIKQFRVCGYCGEEVSYEIYGANYATIDHIIPKSKGGSEALENKTLCCLGCNRGKGNRNLKG